MATLFKNTIETFRHSNSHKAECVGVILFFNNNIDNLKVAGAQFLIAATQRNDRSR